MKLNTSATEAFEFVTETYGDETLSGARVLELHERFSGGRDSVEVENAGIKIQGNVNCLLRNPFYLSGRGSDKNGEPPEGRSKVFVPELLVSMETPNSNVCEC
ncbi:hypothetical protein TNCV_2395511 [Trichonephila clavipes]|nr:hypothetical protein TNCV_2395511 [Trichonephila clavipes]